MMNLKNIGIQMTDKVLLFINGVPPSNLPETEGYSLIACTDGAFHYLKEKNFPLDQLDFISGDFDSHSGQDDSVYEEKFIYTPDQDKTDFQKALEIIESRGGKEIEIYGASGGEMDHFLGNLTVAFQFKEKMDITFYDESSTYFFAKKKATLNEVHGKTISLYPFPAAIAVMTKGLKWPLNQETLDLTKRIGTRNVADSETVEISYTSGDLIIFVGK
ncbi:thiamine diphosphokinase [Chryseobacterium sp. MP_3.2]|uniref:thiamine diphosphokinase n=1 Tax=Chryseobacterium sp. MP_3.2 TaxID=3071712 RepID=UPI002E01452C|nr:thiamine pyrophosphokinase [Chryseobacterium sp. MP_3.2]